MATFGSFDFLSPGPSQLVTRSLLVLIQPGPGWNQTATVSGQFLVGGVVVGSFAPSVFASSWEWQGIVPATIHAGQPFTVSVRARQSNFLFTFDTTRSVDVVLENMLPVVTIDPFQSPKGVVQLPYSFTLSGTAGEGFGPPYGISVVQCQIGNGPFVNADPAVPGVWSHWSLPVSITSLGDTVVTARAIDPFGAVTTVQATVSVLQYPIPAVIDPNAKRTEFLHLPTTSSVTSWTRLEPQVAGADMGQASNARVFDPLWLMTRQWQLGEFQGEDTGSPVKARVRATAAPLTRCVLGELLPNDAPARPVVLPYDPTRIPLEALVE